MKQTTVLNGRYQIITQLGRGGFGETYLAQDRHLPGQPRCVVKHLKPINNDPATWDLAKRLFNTEAEVLYKLGKHERIPELFSHFEDKQEFYLVQQYIPGRTLQQELPLGKQWSEGEVTALLHDILKILEFVHQHRCIHRDLKPANLIRRESDRQLVLIDFGAVKQIRPPTITPLG